MNTKEKSLQRLSDLEQTISEAQREAKQLREIIENDDCKIDSFEKACKKVGVSTNEANEVIEEIRALPHLSKKQKNRMIAEYKLEIIIRAFNGEDWESWVDWNDKSQSKYFPWFYLNSSVFRLSDVYVYYWYAYSGLGGWLAFKRKEDAKYCVEQFIDLYKDLMI